MYVESLKNSSEPTDKQNFQLSKITDMKTKTKNQQTQKQVRLLHLAITYSHVESIKPSENFLQFINDMDEHDPFTRYMCFSKYITNALEKVYDDTKDENLGVALKTYVEAMETRLSNYIEGRTEVEDFAEGAAGAEKILRHIFKDDAA